jgi:hypothetical protein
MKTDAWDLMSKNILQLKVSHHNKALEKAVRMLMRTIDSSYEKLTNNVKVLKKDKSEDEKNSMNYKKKKANQLFYCSGE